MLYNINTHTACDPATSCLVDYLCSTVHDTNRQGGWDDEDENRDSNKRNYVC